MGLVERMDEPVGFQSKPASLGSMQNSDAGSSGRSEYFPDLDPAMQASHTMSEINSSNHKNTIISSSQCTQRDHADLPHHSDGGNFQIESSRVTNGISYNTASVVKSTAEKALFANNGEISDLSNASTSYSSSPNNINKLADHVDSHNPMEFSKYFQEGYCKAPELDECRDLTEVATDVDSSSNHCEKEKPEEDEDCDDLLGGVFAFSEEG